MASKSGNGAALALDGAGRRSSSRTVGRAFSGNGATSRPTGMNGTSIGSRRRRSPEKVMQPPVVATDEMIAAEREALILEKQKSLDELLNRHDDLVREMFHMQHYVAMVSFDPVAAKTDNTEVFNEFKSKYDLLEKAASTSGGPTRKTRSAHTERRQNLSAAISSPSFATPSSQNSKSIRKGRPGFANDAEIWDILSSAKASASKGKGKGKVKQKEKQPVDEEESGSGALVPAFEDTGELPTTPFVNQNTPNRKVTLPALPSTPQPPLLPKAIENIQEIQEIFEGNVPVRNGRPKRPPDESISVVMSRRSKRLKESPPPEILPKRTRGASTAKMVSEARPTSRVTERSLRKNKTISAPPAPPAPVPSSALVPPPPTPKLNIKRIKLIVRRPPPTITHPKQRFPPAKFNQSLSNFLSSYISLNDEDVDEPTMRRRAAEHADILEREQLFRKQGRFIPGTDVLFGTKPEDIPYTSPKRTSRDVWDSVVNDVIANRKMRAKRPSGRSIAAGIAAKLRAHWHADAEKLVRASKLEEARAMETAREMAFTTMKLVNDEWKKAVYHVREQERLKREAEEIKRGHEHLDAILNQSGHLLQTQHGDLSRDIRSRSNSAFDDDSESSDPDDTDEEERLQEDEEGADEDGPLDDSAAAGLVEPSEEGTSDHGEEDDEDEEEEMENGSNLLLANGRNSVLRASEESRSSPTVVDDPRAGPHSPIPVTKGMLPVDDGNTMDIDNSSDIVAHELTALPQSPSHPQSSIPNLTDYDLADSSPTSSRASRVPDDASGQDTALPKEVDSVTSSVPATSSVDLLAAESAMPPTLAEIEDVQPSMLSEVPEHSAEHAQEEDPLPFMNEVEPEKMDVDDEVEVEAQSRIPDYLKPYAVAPVEWIADSKVIPPTLLRGVLRPYQQSGLEWLASLHTNNVNGILADEMGLGKTIQTIALLAHLACDRGIWGPHLIIVPTSVLLNWEMEFKKFLPGFKILSYHGSTKRRKELRQGWNDKHHFNACITSYTLASRDAHIFKRKAWYYMILDEAHMIKNFKSQRWNILLMFRSFRRLLLTGTPLQNNLTELWALLQFLMSGSNFANLKEFGEWFSNPLEKAIEMGNVLDDETMQRVSKLHTVLRPYLLRRLKRDVEKELPSKYEHLVLCPLSKRQRFLYDEFMSRAQTRDDLQSGVYQKIANILMQLRKVCNHPDLFEVRPVVTSFTMPRSAIADFEIKELLIRKLLFEEEDEKIDLDLLGFQFVNDQHRSTFAAIETKRLDATSRLPFIEEIPGEPPPKDTRTIQGFKAYSAYIQRSETIARWAHVGYLNKLRCSRIPAYGQEYIACAKQFYKPITPLSAVDTRFGYMDNVYRINSAVMSYAERADSVAGIVDRFAFVTPVAVALDLPRISLSGYDSTVVSQPLEFDEVLHRSSVKLQIAFPDPSLLQYDCGKLQELARLLREKKAGGHRILIFTQMTKILDILEIFLSFHGYLYLRLDGATKIEDRQYITERFNLDKRIFCFIASSRSGGVGINLTGADTVVFYDSDFNPQMDRQCEDRAHRIGQIRDVHIYRFVSQYTVEEAMLRKANQKRSLDEIVIQKGEFDWRSLFSDETALTKALGEVEDTEDAHAAAVAAKEAIVLEGADEADFSGDVTDNRPNGKQSTTQEAPLLTAEDAIAGTDGDEEQEGDEIDEEGGAIADYLLAVVERDWDYFRDWRL